MNLFTRLTHNLWLKGLSVALAMLMSVYVVKVVDPMFSQSLSLPVELRDLNETLIVADPRAIPEDVRIKVTGKYSQVRGLPGREAIYIDCSGYVEPGTYTFALQPPEMNEVQVTNQEVSQVQLTLEEKTTVTMPVTIDRRGDVDENYYIRSEELSLDSVEITGPKPIIERIAIVQIEPNVAGVAEDIRRQMHPINLYDENDYRISSPAIVLRPAQVRYSLLIEPIASIKVLKVYPDYRGRLPEDVLLDRLIADPQTIPVDAGLVDSDIFAVTTAPIDLTGAHESFTIEARLLYPFEIPEGVHLPQTCQVTAQIISIEEAGAVRVPVQVLGESNNYDYIKSPPEVVIISEGLMQLENTDKAQIQAVINAEGLGPGEYRLVPQVRLPLSLQQAKIVPETVQITIIQNGE